MKTIISCRQNNVMFRGLLANRLCGFYSLILIGRTPPGLTHKGPFVSPPRMAAADNETDKNSNEKNVICNHPCIISAGVER